MAETILPGVYIDVRSEGLIVAGQISVGTVGMVGTASRGPVAGKPEFTQPSLLSSYADAVRVFGDYDAWIDGKSNELTLVRSLQLAFAHGASSVYAVRVAGGAAAKAVFTVAGGGGAAATLTAKSEGAWANEIGVNVAPAEEHAIIVRKFKGSDLPITLKPNPLVESARNRVEFTDDPSGITRQLKVVYTGAVAANEAKIDTATGALTFGDAVTANDDILVTYTVDKSKAAKVTLRMGTQTEVYTAVDGKDLEADAGPDRRVRVGQGIRRDRGGAQGHRARGRLGALYAGKERRVEDNYRRGWRRCSPRRPTSSWRPARMRRGRRRPRRALREASTDSVKLDRIAVVGSASDQGTDEIQASVDLLGSDRLIFVAPGHPRNAAVPPADVTLPGAYAAAAVGGLLSACPRT